MFPPALLPDKQGSKLREDYVLGVNLNALLPILCEARVRP